MDKYPPEAYGGVSATVAGFASVPSSNIPTLWPGRERPLPRGGLVGLA